MLPHDRGSRNAPTCTKHLITLPCSLSRLQSSNVPSQMTVRESSVSFLLPELSSFCHKYRAVGLGVPYHICYQHVSNNQTRPVGYRYRRQMMDCSCGCAIDDISYLISTAGPVHQSVPCVILACIPRPCSSCRSLGTAGMMGAGRCTMIRWAPILSELLTRTVRLGTTGHAPCSGMPQVACHIRARGRE
jgi:hypothetical protein